MYQQPQGPYPQQPPQQRAQPQPQQQWAQPQPPQPQQQGWGQPPHQQGWGQPRPPQQYGVPAQPPYGAPGQPHQPAPAVPGFGMPGVQPYGRMCRFCGCGPAADTTFRGHRGMIIVMSFLKTEGPFCRDCGLAVFREMTAKTLIGGWYGYASAVITPFTVLMNLVRRGKVAGLPAPTPPADGSQYGRPFDPGPPLLHRPIALIGLCVPLFVFLAVVVANLA